MNEKQISWLSRIVATLVFLGMAYDVGTGSMRSKWDKAEWYELLGAILGNGLLIGGISLAVYFIALWAFENFIFIFLTGYRFCLLYEVKF